MVGTNSIYVMDPQEVPNIPKDFTVTYGCIVVYYIDKKADLDRFHITTGGNIINYPGELTPKTVYLTTSKIVCNSVLSTD